ncbi:MAG: hypothetical protein ACRDF7_07960, partial [Candidatus Limnocylindrales bacterium]
RKPVRVARESFAVADARGRLERRHRRTAERHRRQARHVHDEAGVRVADLRPAGRPLPRSRLPAVVEADSLATLLGLLAGPPFSASDDELRNLGIVLILAAASGGSSRVASAHYIRPVERDAQGHLQRRPPAVLATWDQAGGGFDDFAWGILPELAARIAMEPGALTDERARRAKYLEGLVDAGITGRDAVRLALAGRALTGPRGD